MRRSATDEFAIRLDSIRDLFWPYDARPVADRDVNADVRWALIDEWDRVRSKRPAYLTLVVPASERDETDEQAVASALHTSLHHAAGPLREIDPLTRQEKVAMWMGIITWALTIAIGTAIDRSTDDVLAGIVSQGVVVIGWVALWPPASRFLTEVVPHFFNRKRFAEFADIEVRFAWTGQPSTVAG